jgi:hypothetical protein
VGRRHAAFLHDLYVEHRDGEIATEAFRLGELVKRAREAGRGYFGLRVSGGVGPTISSSHDDQDVATTGQCGQPVTKPSARRTAPGAVP